MRGGYHDAYTTLTSQNLILHVSGNCRIHNRLFEHDSIRSAVSSGGCIGQFGRQIRSRQSTGCHIDQHSAPAQLGGDYPGACWLADFSAE
jgi:hypothetical protein